MRNDGRLPKPFKLGGTGPNLTNMEVVEDMERER
jgi:hypothetical protein